MTAATTAPATVQPGTDSRLAQLAEQYDLAEAEAKKAAEAFEAIKNAIKLELINAAPGTDDIRLAAEGLQQPLRLHAVTSMRVDSKALKADMPMVYEAYSKPSVAWRLERVRG